MNAYDNGNRYRQLGGTGVSFGGVSFGIGLNRLSLLRQALLVTAVVVLTGCGDAEPAFPPSSGGPTIAAVPNGLPGDGANADYSDQELRALLGSAPRPLPAPPKMPNTNAPGGAAPAATNAPAGDNGQPAAVVAPAPGTVPVGPVPDAATNDPNAYPDINTTPMVRPTPVPDADAAPQQKPADNTSAPATSPEQPKPQNSSMLEQPLRTMMVETTAGTSTTAPDQTAQSVTTSDDEMFSKPALPAYSGYDQTMKQPQSPSAQQLYHSPYGNGGQFAQPGVAYNSSVFYPGQNGAYQGYGSQSYGGGAQVVSAPGGQPVGLVYFGAGSVKLAGVDRQVLLQIAQVQRAYGGVIRIIGHASSRTDNMTLDQHRQVNIDIAQARAKAVAQQLVRYGVAPAFVQIAGASDSQPLYPEFMPAGEAANRRAEVYLSSN